MIIFDCGIRLKQWEFTDGRPKKKCAKFFFHRHRCRSFFVCFILRKAIIKNTDGISLSVVSATHDRDPTETLNHEQAYNWKVFSNQWTQRNYVGPFSVSSVCRLHTKSEKWAANRYFRDANISSIGIITSMLFYPLQNIVHENMRRSIWCI